jgi:hypothetical protein
VNKLTLDARKFEMTRTKYSEIPFFFCSYERTCLELCEAIRNASLSWNATAWVDYWAKKVQVVSPLWIQASWRLLIWPYRTLHHKPPSFTCWKQDRGNGNKKSRFSIDWHDIVIGMCDYRRGIDWWMDLLTSYTHATLNYKWLQLYGESPHFSNHLSTS